METNAYFPVESCLSIEETKQLLDFGIRQSIVPILYRGIRKLNPSNLNELCSIFEPFMAKCHYDYIQRDNAIQCISNALESQQIEYILLKGAVIRDLYPQKWMRTSCDIDVLVHEDELNCAISIIEKRRISSHVIRGAFMTCP